ncbi:MAG: heavy metal translocating P-type ATPase [Myxococcota bacterium]
MLFLSFSIIGATVCVALDIHDRYTSGRSTRRSKRAPSVPREEPKSTAGGQQPPPEEDSDGVLDSALDSVFEAGEGLVRKVFSLERKQEWRAQVAAVTNAERVAVVSEAEKGVRRRIVMVAGMFGMYGVGITMLPPLAWMAAGGLGYQLYVMGKEALETYQQEDGKIGNAALNTVWLGSALFTGHVGLGFGLVLPQLFAKLWMLRLVDDTHHNLDNILGEDPLFVWLVVDEVEVQVPVSRISPGDKIAVSPGETIPFDGRVIAGAGAVDQHILTGESQPVDKFVGDPVYAATLLLMGKIRLEVTAPRDESKAVRLVDTLASTMDYREISVHRGKAIADDIAVPTMLIGAAGFFALGANGALGILTCFPGYSLVWSSSLNVMNHLNKSVDAGILIKDGRALEGLSAVDMVVFDKTGTLTEPTPRVTTIRVRDPYTAEQILAFAAAMETGQTHPIARAVVAESKTRGLPVLSAECIEVVPGYGIKATINGQSVRVGSTRFMHREGLSLTAPESRPSDGTVIFMGVDDAVVGEIELRNEPRQEALEVINALKHRGLGVCIISGDHHATTRHFAESVGIDQYYAEVLPKDKARIIERLQTRGHSVCFVGDGINDSIALKTADVSVSIQGATMIAVDVAQVVLRDGSLRSLDKMFEIAEQYERGMKRNLYASTVPGVINTLVLCTIYPSLAVSSTLFMANTALSLLLNVLPSNKPEPEANLRALDEAS